MMCDAANRSFRTQLAAILDKLTRAALGEISSLADERSSALHAEMLLHKTENEALNKRCYSLEVQLRAAREAQTYPAHVDTIDHQHPAEQQQSVPAINGVYGKDWCMDLWKEEKLSSRRKAAVEPAAATSMGPQAVDLLEREPAVVFVKEETYDGHPIGQRMRLTGNRKVVGFFEEEEEAAAMLHRPVDELQLHSVELNNFSMSAHGQTRTQSTLMDKLIDDATMSVLPDDATPPPTERCDYANGADTNATRELVILPKAAKRFQF
ncbi:uncharacterized protein [Brachionichthys hirsutus]|uniref:uncharacterized protein n=1 Tax=Brachionichthys hirsutus TaxID=412623 RepID=UPI00360460F7